MTPEDLAARKAVVDVIEPVLSYPAIDLVWLNKELDRLEARGAFATVGGLTGLARYAHFARAGELLIERDAESLRAALEAALDAPDRIPDSEAPLTWLLERQLLRSPALLERLAPARHDWARRALELGGRGLPAAQWSSPWHPSKRKSAGPIHLEFASFDERIHAQGLSVPRTPSSEEHEAQWATQQFPNTFHLRWIHDEAALRIWLTLDPRGVLGRLEECVPRFGVPGLATSLRLLALYPEQLGAFADVESPRVAMSMAEALAGRPVAAQGGWLTPHEVAQKWFARFPQAAVVGLVPALLARGKTQPVAAKALRLIRASAPLEFERGLSRSPPEARAAVIELLDEVVVVPTRKPSLPSFLSSNQVPWPITLDGTRALQGGELDDLLALLKLTPLEGAPWLDALRTQFTADSLQRLAETLMKAWLFVGGPPKEKWALHAIAHFSTESVTHFLGVTAGQLASTSLSARAREFLDVLAAMNTRASLAQLHGLTRKVRAKTFRAKAESVFAEAAARSGMSSLELAERLVPDFGLSVSGVLSSEPPIHLVVEGVKARLVDGAGKTLKALPPIADEEVAAEWAEIKKKGSLLAREVADRLERRMVEGARMNVEHFTEVYGLHGLARQVAAGVLFGLHTATARRTLFTLAETPNLDPDLLVSVVHPLELEDADRAIWRARLGKQPFLQLARPCTTFENTAAFERAIRAFRGRTLGAGALIRLETRGWVRGNVEEAGRIWSASRRLGGLEVVVEFTPGIPVREPANHPEQQITQVTCTNDGVHPVAMSELISDLTVS
jgi:hypothetical protein